MENFRKCSAPLQPQFLLMHDNDRPHVARVRRQNLVDEGTDTTERPSRSLGQTRPQQPSGTLFDPPGCSSDSGAHLDWSGEDIPQDTSRCLIRRGPRRGQASIRARGGHSDIEKHFELRTEFWQNGLACHGLVSLVRDIYKIKPSVDWKHYFQQKMWHTLRPRNRTVHIIFFALRSDAFSMCWFNFWSSAFKDFFVKILLRFW